MTLVSDDNSCFAHKYQIQTKRMDSKDITADIEDDLPYRPYEVKSYSNSDTEPLGLTLKSKNTEFIKAHGLIKSSLIKGKEIKTSKGNMKILDSTVKNNMTVAIIEVLHPKDNSRGTVELKVYEPSKKKGATLEARKKTDTDFKYIEHLGEILSYIVDGIIAGENVAESILKVKVTETSKANVFVCDICKWEGKQSSALKTHRTKMHGQSSRKRVCENATSKSPPRKKLEIDNSETKIDDRNDIEDDKSIKSLLEKRIKELETTVESLVTENKTLKDEKSVKNPQKDKFPPCHLDLVHEHHLPDLKGFKMIYRTIPNGACLENALAVHVYGDENMGPKVKEKVNNHIADYYDPFYHEKISLPYKEKVGVGKNSYVVEKKTKEELIDFLRSKESLTVYSNNQEMMAIANLFNIKIFTFTYNAEGSFWHKVYPDKDIAAKAGIKLGKWVPDMYLYNSQDTHYDLLVSEYSWLAVKDVKKISLEIEDKESTEKLMIETPTKKCNPKENSLELESSTPRTFKCSECESVFETQNVLDIHANCHKPKVSKCEVCSEVFKTDANLKVHFEVKHSQNCESSLEKHDVKCVNCEMLFQTEEEMKSHFKSLHGSKSCLDWSCNDCEESFETEKDMKSHFENLHMSTRNLDWNCNDCSYQGYTSDDLMNHLKLTGHLPSKTVEVRKASNKDISDRRKCYTCDLELDNVFSLMEHRRNMHPSNQKCRNFPDGKCIYGKRCWFIHDEELMELDESSNNAVVLEFNCKLCENCFSTKDHLMKHKKKEHVNFVPHCEMYARANCRRNDDQCWYLHNKSQSESCRQTSTKVFQLSHPNTFPPDLLQNIQNMVESMNKMCLRVETIEKKLQETQL